MSIDAVYLARGCPDKENDWGSGDIQLVYGNGSKYIYLRDDKVTSWQYLDG
jgi:hypothetical protein